MVANSQAALKAGSFHCINLLTADFLKIGLSLFELGPVYGHLQGFQGKHDKIDSQ